MQFYVTDTTINPPQDKLFVSYDQVVGYLENMSIRAFKQTRKQRMVMLEEIGHGIDDTNSVTFVRSMAEQFNMGIIREGNKMRCDITSVALFQREEFGN